MASKLYSDFGAHLPLVRSFSFGSNWPPEYPTFPGEPIRYHFLFYYFAALFEKIGFNFAWAVNLPSIFGFTLLLYLIYWSAKTIFTRKSAGIIAIFLFLFNGSLSFVEFIQKNPLSLHSVRDIISAQHFASFGPWSGRTVAAFWNLNIYTNQRHLAFSFALMLFSLTPLLITLYKKRRIPLWLWLLEAISMLVLPWMNQAAVVCTFPLVWLPLLVNFTRIKKIILPYIIVFLFALPGMAYTYFLGNHPITLWLGYLSQSKTLENITLFWIYNLGIYLFLFPLLFFWTDRRGRSLLGASFILFILANLINLSPDIINNHKLVNAFMLIMVMFTAGLVVELWHLSRYLRPVVIGLVFIATFSGVIDFFPVKNDARGHMDDWQRLPAAVWIREHTPKNAVFLTNVYLYHPAHYAGRKTYEDYGYFNWSMGYPDGQRRALLDQLFSPSLPIPTVCALLRRENIDYIALHPGRGDLGLLDPHQSTIARKFHSDYTAPDGMIIYSVMNNCQASL